MSTSRKPLLTVILLTLASKLCHGGQFKKEIRTVVEKFENLPSVHGEFLYFHYFHHH